MYVADGHGGRGGAEQRPQLANGRFLSTMRIIQLLAEGNSNKETAAALGVSVKTIEAHRANIMRKLHLRSVTDLVRYAIRNKIVQA